MTSIMDSRRIAFNSRFLPVSINIIVCTLMLFIPIAFSDETKQCIRSKFGIPCSEDKDCYEFEETHLYCNKTLGVNLCSFQIETYAGQALADMDCPGLEYSAEPWSNPVSDSLLDSALGVDCMRLCYTTESCFGVTIHDHKCYLRNDLCFGNLKPSEGALLGVMATVREDYHCGCHYPFTRRRSNGQILSWTPACPESQLDRNPYRCCSEKGLCVKCNPGESPPLPPTRANLSDLIGIDHNLRNKDNGVDVSNEGEREGDK